MFHTGLNFTARKIKQNKIIKENIIFLRNFFSNKKRISRPNPILAKDIASPVKNTKKKLSAIKGTNNKLSFFDFFNLTMVNKKTIKKNLDK